MLLEPPLTFYFIIITTVVLFPYGCLLSLWFKATVYNTYYIIINNVMLSVLLHGNRHPTIPITHHYHLVGIDGTVFSETGHLLSVKATKQHISVK